MKQYDDIVIFGADGWLGKNLLASLSQTAIRSKDCKVTAVVKEAEQVKNLDEFAKDIDLIVNADLTDENTLKFLQTKNGKRLIVHCASLIHPANATLFHKVNFKGTEKLLKAAKQVNVDTTFVYISSNSPFGTNRSNDLSDTFDEMSPYNPYMKYGKTKMLAEQAVRSSASENFCFCVLRAPWFYGKYQPERQFEFFKMIQNGKAPLVGSGENLRSMVSTSRLAEAVWLAAANKDAENDIFWIADKHPYTMKSIIDTIRQIMDKDFELRTSAGYLKLPNCTSEIAYWVDKTLQTFGFYNQKIHVLSEMNKNIHCGVLKAENVLGFIPEMNLEAGMKTSIEDAIKKGKLK